MLETEVSEGQFSRRRGLGSVVALPQATCLPALTNETGAQSVALVGPLGELGQAMHSMLKKQPLNRTLIIREHPIELEAPNSVEAASKIIESLLHGHISGSNPKFASFAQPIPNVGETPCAQYGADDSFLYKVCRVLSR
jgi:hypothetical protein